ncbi:DDE superfamily endonuclease [Popillia japonica]|uniref:DDE superfamily endonuclease n=1 Tax=Popillia japonica TaxID=7064 RepID=A0AAW1KIJ0_POPJA
MDGFKEFNNPLQYSFSKDASMTSRIFYGRLHEIFLKEARKRDSHFSKENNLPLKVFLLIDNCSAHSPTDEFHSTDGNLVVDFFPPNVTAAVQPMGQNPIKITKLTCRSKLLASIIAEGGE